MKHTKTALFSYEGTIKNMKKALKARDRAKLNTAKEKKLNGLALGIITIIVITFLGLAI